MNKRLCNPLQLLAAAMALVCMTQVQAAPVDIAIVSGSA